MPARRSQRAAGNLVLESYMDGVSIRRASVEQHHCRWHQVRAVDLSDSLAPPCRVATPSAKIRDLATLEFVQAKSNVALLGPPGVGKTMLAVALAVTACQAGLSIYFTTLDDLVRRLRAAEATGRFNRQLQAYLRPAVLVVRRSRLPAAGPGRSQHGLPTRLPQIRTRHHDHHHPTKASPNGAACSATTSSPPPSSTDCCTTAT